MDMLLSVNLTYSDISRMYLFSFMSRFMSKPNCTLLPINDMRLFTYCVKWYHCKKGSFYSDLSHLLCLISRYCSEILLPFTFHNL